MAKKDKPTPKNKYRGHYDYQKEIGHAFFVGVPITKCPKCFTMNKIRKPGDWCEHCKLVRDVKMERYIRTELPKPFTNTDGDTDVDLIKEEG